MDDDKDVTIIEDIEPVKIVSECKLLQNHLKFSSKHFSSSNQVLKWNNQMYHLELDPLDDVAILRYEIFKETQVKSERQKILNLKAKAGE